MMNQKLPSWLRKPFPKSTVQRNMRVVLDKYKLFTVCEEAFCPNRGECFSQGTATFMILGNVCTRNCGFCGVASGQPQPPDKDEPMNVAAAAKKMGLKHVVITSVTRDDLDDGGAGQFVQTIAALNYELPNADIEILTPDFKGQIVSLDKIIFSHPHIFNHNLETVNRLSPIVRSHADYFRSLFVLDYIKKNSKITTKSGFMVGLGETLDEIKKLLYDLRQVDCDIVTIGQYLAPSLKHLPVIEFIKPEIFDEYKGIAEDLGIKRVFAGPLVRSSYQAETQICADGKSQMGAD